MGDLINRKALLEEFNPDEENLNGVAVRMRIIQQTTAFDLERAIVEIKKKRDYCYAEMEKEKNKSISDVNPLTIYTLSVQGMVYDNALSIFTAAANAMNGKIGG